MNVVSVCLSVCNEGQTGRLAYNTKMTCPDASRISQNDRTKLYQSPKHIKVKLIMTCPEAARILYAFHPIAPAFSRCAPRRHPLA
jgi:hypothetical protein